MTPVTPRELELLCLLVRPQPDLEAARVLARAGYSTLELFRLASAHGVMPQFTAALRDVTAGEFEFVKQTLEDHQRIRAVAYLETAKEIAGIATAFSEIGIPFMMLKGMALAIQLYGDISRRESNDIDFIIPETHLGKAEAALANRGYKHELGMSGEWRRAFLHYHGQYTLVSPDPNLPSIDLHWELAPRGVPFPPLNFWAHPDQVKIAHRSIPTIASGLLPYYLAAHGAKEGWRSLGWICDFAQLYCRFDLDWAALLRKATWSLQEAA